MYDPNSDLDDLVADEIQSDFLGSSIDLYISLPGHTIVSVVTL